MEDELELTPADDTLFEDHTLNDAEYEYKRDRDNSECAKISMVDFRMRCPKCGTEVAHFNGLENIPEYFYCPKCMDKAYNEDGEVIARLE